SKAKTGRADSLPTRGPFCPNSAAPRNGFKPFHNRVRNLEPPVARQRCPAEPDNAEPIVWRIPMRTSLAAAAALLMLCTGAQADNFASRFGGRNGLIADGQTTVGVGLICDTSEQALRFVALRGAGSEPEQAMQTVNSEAHKE